MPTTNEPTFCTGCHVEAGPSVDSLAQDLCDRCWTPDLPSTFRRCGLNADWSSDVWQVNGTNVFLIDDEEVSPDRWMVVQRHYLEDDRGAYFGLPAADADWADGANDAIVERARFVSSADAVAFAENLARIASTVVPLSWDEDCHDEWIAICTCGSWPDRTHGPSNLAHEGLCALLNQRTPEMPTFRIPTLEIPCLPPVMIGEGSEVIRAFGALVGIHADAEEVTLSLRAAARLLRYLDEWAAETADGATFAEIATIIRSAREDS